MELVNKANTSVSVDYFFKAFDHNDDKTLLTGFVITNDNKVLIYESNDLSKEPMLIEEFSLEKKTIKEIKKYLFSIKDLYIDLGYSHEKYITNNQSYSYKNYNSNNSVYEVKGYFKDTNFEKYQSSGKPKQILVKKKIKGDPAYSKIVKSLIKIMNGETLINEDYINHPKRDKVEVLKNGNF